MRYVHWLLALLALAPPIAAAQGAERREFSFELKAPGEAVAEVIASAPGAAWGRAGAEAAIATAYLDDHYNQDVIVLHGEERWTYRVFLGPLEAGNHRLRVERNAQWSAPSAGLKVENVHVIEVEPKDPEYRASAHAPILLARADTVGHFSDAPLLMWYERFQEGPNQTIQYSIVLSNEDSGTPTEALMARWGRASDIEYVYRVTLDAGGKVQQEIFQGMDHDDRAFHGQRLGQHPLILVATPNNCFADTGYSVLQYHLLPVFADLSGDSREELMDRFPWTYSIMAQELEREGKLRPYDVTQGENISDPRNYLYVEMEAENRQSGLVVWVKLKGRPQWYSSHRGRWPLVISRSGWYRTTVELPPQTAPEAIESLALECVDLRDPRPFEPDDEPLPPPAQSLLHKIGKAFLLEADYRPGKNILQVDRAITFHPGDMQTFPLDAH
ncbi:MAG: hypothetical protein ABSG54_12295 [Terriglobia bacterium]|jgi:hypothetical protein